MHGGARGSGAPLGNKNALKHGDFSAEALALHNDIRARLRDIRRDVLEAVSAVRKRHPKTLPGRR
jgi:uncharacterized protein YjcR